MDARLISIQEAMKQLNISAVGLDNNIKKKGFKKHYKGRKAFITIEDFEAIKKTVELNGRVKKIKDKDNEDFELLKRKEELEKENEKLKSEIQSLSVKIESTYNATIDLKQDKDDLKALLEQSNNNLIATQKLLQNEQELHKQEKARRIELEEKLRSTSYLLESSKVEQETAISKVNEATEMVDNLEKQVKLLKETKEAEVKEVEQKLHEVNRVKLELENTIQNKEIELTDLNNKIEVVESQLLEERANKEVIIGELNKYKNMTFTQKLKALFVK